MTSVKKFVPEYTPSYLQTLINLKEPESQSRSADDDTSYKYYQMRMTARELLSNPTDVDKKDKLLTLLKGLNLEY